MNTKTGLSEIVLVLIIVISWIAGVAIAKGIFEVIVAILMPPYSWYLVIEKIMMVNGYI